MSTVLVGNFRFKNLWFSQVGILSWGNLRTTNAYIDFSVVFKCRVRDFAVISRTKVESRSCKFYFVHSIQEKLYATVRAIKILKF